MWVVLLAVVTELSAGTIDVRSLDRVVEQSMKAWGVPGCSVAIVQNDQVVFIKGYGVKELGKPDRVTPDTIFAIGSTSKAFTTAGMAMLVDEGKMSWDDPVRKHVEFFRLMDPMANELVTMRDLVSHRTGLSRNDLLWYNSPLSREEIIRRVAFVKPTAPFRFLYQYQNIMFATAGYAAGKAAGTSWEEYTQKRIFDPLGMKSTSMTTINMEKTPDHASPHSKNKQKAVQLTQWRNLDNIAPAGAINSTATDMAQWLRLQVGDGAIGARRLISAKNLRETHTPQMVIRPEEWGRSYNPETNQMAYGLAWTLQDYRGMHIVSHGGAIDGFRATVTLVPKERLGIVVLANLGEDNMPEALRWMILDQVMGLPARDWNEMLIDRGRKQEETQETAEKLIEEKRQKFSKPSKPLDQYTGTYEEPAYGRAIVMLDEGKLRFTWSNYRGSLDHYHYDTFRVKAPRLDGLARFELNANGDVTSLEMLGVEFKKVTP